MLTGLPFVVFSRKIMENHMKRTIRNIMNEMDKIEKVEITPDLLDGLKNIFNEEIESEKTHNQKIIKNRRKISDIRRDMIKINKQKPLEKELDQLVDMLNEIK